MKKILIVDDDQNQLFSLKIALENLDDDKFEVITVESGEERIQY